MRRLAAPLAAAAVLAAGCGAHSSANGLPWRPPSPALVKQAALAACPDTHHPHVAGGLPNLRLPCLGGSGTVDLAGLRGPAVVNVGWSACAPCREEAPAVRTLAKSGKVTVLMVDDEPEPDDGLRFAITEGFHFAMVSDQHGTIEGALPVRGFPTSFFVRADGTIAGGPYYDKLPTGAALDKLVSERLGVTLS